MVEIESMARYVSPVNPAVFPHLTLVLLGIGIFFTAWFFVYEVTSTKFTRDLFKNFWSHSWQQYFQDLVFYSFSYGLEFTYDLSGVMNDVAFK
ncbi:hypothetical protein L9F63_023927 [Diploptera punctata]|uniref:Dolichyl-diphosphooligosaccharide-protein glycosyltransferase subunit TMEM258 n=1 Tax=Diploptera punctata TaxID=6984 RepID=A0AAD7ZHR2_DIPPU|nr:hypothetical protein L9F63_023927 [Diploptera punctata]